MSTIQYTRRADVGLGGHHLLDQVRERDDPGLFRNGAEQAGLMHVIGTHVGQGPAPLVLELDLGQLPGAGWAGRVTAVQRLEL